MHEPILQLDKLEKSYGRRPALRPLSMSLPAGSFLSIFGANGAGKSTLLKLIALLEHPSAGSLRICAKDALKEPDLLRSRIGFLSHASMLYLDLSAYENLLLFARLYGVTNPKERVSELLFEMELDHRAYDKVREFSRGMMQRLSLARALINTPDILILDEPYSGLDLRSCERLTELLARLKKDCTCLMVSHETEYAYKLASHVLFMSHTEGSQLIELAQGADEKAAYYPSFLQDYKQKVGCVHA